MMAVRSTTFSEEKMFGDLVLHMESQEYCLVSAKIANPVGADTSTNVDPVGQPVILDTGVWTLILAADIATATGVIVQGSKFTLLDGAATNPADPYLILIKAPAIINKDRLAANDSHGGAITLATYVTALEAAGFVVRAEAVNTAIQVE